VEKEPPPSFPMGCCTAPPSRVAALSPDPAPLARSSRVAPPPSPRCTGLASPRLSAALLPVPSPVACAPRPVWPGRGPQPAAASRARSGLAACSNWVAPAWPPLSTLAARPQQRRVKRGTDELLRHEGAAEEEDVHN